MVTSTSRRSGTPGATWIGNSRTADDEGSETFFGLLLRQRGRIGLTQRQLATRVGVSVRAVQDWEAGVSYTSAERLQALIGVYTEMGGFARGAEADEAEALWDAALRESTRLRAPFDRAWFADVLGARGTEPDPDDAEPESAVVTTTPIPDRPSQRHQDWGDAPDVLGFVGRATELCTLQKWVNAGSRMVAVLGMGGIGKTTLAARLAEEVAASFELVYWRNVGNTPSFTDWLSGAISFLSGEQQHIAQDESAELLLLLELVRRRRCLLVLDNFETLLEPNRREASFQDGYSGFGRLLHLIADSRHQSCLLLTSREMPPELESLGSGGTARALELRGLGTIDGQALLREKRLAGNADVWAALVTAYDGNGLALKIVGETIQQLFGGDIATFLEGGGPCTMVGGLRRLLESQVDRLSEGEQDVLTWLAVKRAPVSLAVLASAMGPRAHPATVLEAVGRLRRRSLVERGEQVATFTLQSIVLEYVTTRLVERVAREIERAEPALLVKHELINLQSRDYVKRGQERLIGEPVVETLVRDSGSITAAERWLLNLLDVWRDTDAVRQGYGPGNVLNLLRLLRSNLNGRDILEPVTPGAGCTSGSYLDPLPR